MFQFFAPVSSYTREAGVRALERRIGALCRAVAVQVAQHSHKQSLISSSTDLAKEKQKSGETRIRGDTTSVTESETVDVNNPSAISFPPELPIVIDQLAVEDILGVCFVPYYY